MTEAEKVLRKHAKLPEVAKFKASGPFERPNGVVRFAERAPGERWYRVAEFAPRYDPLGGDVLLDFLPDPRVAEEIAHFANIGAFAIR